MYEKTVKQSIGCERVRMKDWPIRRRLPPAPLP